MEVEKVSIIKGRTSGPGYGCATISSAGILFVHSGSGSSGVCDPRGLCTGITHCIQASGQSATAVRQVERSMCGG